MILCVGTSGSGKSVLLRHLQVHNVVSEGVGVEGEEEGASLRSTIPTVGTNLANLSRSRTKKNQEIVAYFEMGNRTLARRLRIGCVKPHPGCL